MQRLQPMHLIESASIPYLGVSAAATPAEPRMAETGAPAIAVYPFLWEGFPLIFIFFILPGLF
jgi:hypothetical protein